MRCLYSLSLCLFLLSACQLPTESVAMPTVIPRAQVIPEHAHKYTPPEDPAPPILHSAEWEVPVPMPGPINTAGVEDSPFITPDGKTFYFFFTPDVNVLPQEQLLDGATGVYVSHFEDGGWTEPEKLITAPAGVLSLDGCLFADAHSMWICSAREGYTDINFFRAERTADGWGDFVYTGDLFNLEYEVGELHLSADGRELYFHSPRVGGMGGLDVWVTRLLEDEWQPPENVSAINSGEDEGWPFLSSDGLELWFTSTYLGTPALYRSLKIETGWDIPELIVSQFAGEATLDAAGNLYFVHHYFQNEQMMEADIYFAARK